MTRKRMIRPLKYKYWLVWVHGNRPPSHRHYDLGCAMVEAKRLEALTGDPVHVLESIGLLKKGKMIEKTAVSPDGQKTYSDVWKKYYQARRKVEAPKVAADASSTPAEIMVMFMKKNKIKGRELATESGISESRLSLMFNGKKPMPDEVAEKITQSLDNLAFKKAYGDNMASDILGVLK